jgi:hypothetical protein
VNAHLTPAALAKAKALGVVAAALTAGGAGGMVALSHVSSGGSDAHVVMSADATSTPTPDATPTPTVTPSSGGPAAAAAPTAYALPSCPADVNNHGAYVGSVAHDAPKGNAGTHGSWVSRAAQSDCGRSAHASESPKPRHTDAPETHSPEPAKTETHHTASPDAHHSSHGGH